MCCFFCISFYFDVYFILFYFILFYIYIYIFCFFFSIDIIFACVRKSRCRDVIVLRKGRGWHAHARGPGSRSFVYSQPLWDYSVLILRYTLVSSHIRLLQTIADQCQTWRRYAYCLNARVCPHTGKLLTNLSCRNGL